MISGWVQKGAEHRGTIQYYCFLLLILISSFFVDYFCSESTVEAAPERGRFKEHPSSPAYTASSDGLIAVPSRSRFDTEVMRFPQSDFYTTVNEQSSVRNKREAGVLAEKLDEKGAKLCVSLPSGATIRVPMAAVKMFDHGLPDASITGHGVTLADVKKRLVEAQEELRKTTYGMVDDATLGPLKERPSLVVKQKRYADLVQTRPLHQPGDVGEVRAMQFAGKLIIHRLSKYCSID